MTFMLEMDAKSGTRVAIIGNGKDVTRSTKLLDIHYRPRKKLRLLASLPNDDDLEGSIFCPVKGLKKAINTMKPKKYSGYRILIVISASQETVAPFIRDSNVEQEAIRTGTEIYGIFIGSQERAEDLRALCVKTGGKAFFESETV